MNLITRGFGSGQHLITQGFSSAEVEEVTSTTPVPVGGGYYQLLSRDQVSQFIALPRFQPSEWSVNGPTTVAQALVTIDGGMKLTALLRQKADLAAVIWLSEDLYNHRALSYETNRDYRHLTLSFHLKLTGTVPLDDNNGCILTIQGREADGGDLFHSVPDATFGGPSLRHDGNAYVRLINYASNISADKMEADITLNFDDLHNGFSNLSSDWLTVFTGDIDRMFFSFVGAGYDGTDTFNPLASEIEITAEFTEMTLTANSDAGVTTLQMGSIGAKGHHLRVAYGYDDVSVQTPERLLRNSINLGYRGYFVIYIGFSHYYNIRWDAARKDPNAGTVPGPAYPANAPGSFVLDTSRTGLNTAAAAWFTDFLTRCKTGTVPYKVMFSCSNECLLSHMPFEWAQHDWQQLTAGADPVGFAKTGWNPPSGQIVHGTAGINHLVKAMTDLIALAKGVGFAESDCYFQAGEWRWWAQYFDPGIQICAYDALTLADHQSELGRPLLVYKTSNDDKGDTDIPVYLQDCSTVDHTGYNANDHETFAWLRDRLGNSMKYFRDQVKAVYPQAKFGVLFYPTEVFSGVSLQLIEINYPQTIWSYPFADVWQTELYGDITVWNNPDRIFEYEALGDVSTNYFLKGLRLAQDELNYPKANTWGFVGFVEAQGPPATEGSTPGNNGAVGGGPPEGESDADFHSRVVEQWKSIFRASQYFFGYGYGQVLVWASTQRDRDGFIYGGRNRLANLQVVGFPVIAAGKTLQSATLKVTYFEPYWDGAQTYDSVWHAEWDQTNNRWKPAGTPDGNIFYLPGANPGQAVPPHAHFNAELTYSDGTEGVSRFVRVVVATSTGQWVYGAKNVYSVVAPATAGSGTDVRTELSFSARDTGPWDADPDTRTGGSSPYQILLPSDVAPGSIMDIYVGAGVMSFLDPSVAYSVAGRYITFNDGFKPVITTLGATEDVIVRFQAAS